jgi:hypothetical protein
MLLFETAIGTCGVTWSELELTRVAIRLRGQPTGPPVEDSLDVPDDVGDAIAGMVSLLAGFTQEALFA